MGIRYGSVPIPPKTAACSSWRLKGFIEERFNDQNFSLTYVSDHFGLNSIDFHPYFQKKTRAKRLAFIASKTFNVSII